MRLLLLSLRRRRNENSMKHKAGITARFRKTQGIFLLLLGLTACVSQTSTMVSSVTPVSVEQAARQRRALIHLQLASDYYEQQQTRTALEEANQSLQATETAAAYDMRALIYMELGEMKLAGQDFLRALKMTPVNPNLNNNYGWFLCQTGQVKLAMAYFDAALHSKMYKTPAKALNNAGVCSMRLQEFVVAEEYFSSALQYDSKNIITHANLAKIYYDRKGL